MSKRYGRQQKRQAKALLQASEYRVITAEESLMLVRRRASQLESQIDDTAQILDQHFTGFDPADMRVGHMEMLRLEKLQSICAPIIGHQSPIEMMPYYVHELHCMTTNVLDDAFGDSVHIRVHHQETGQIGYAITKQEMERMPRDVFINRVSREMAMQLKQALTD